MRYLLDTCSFYWFASGQPLLSSRALAAIADDDNVIAVSIVAFWEMAIKSSLGKWPLGATLFDFERIAAQEDISILPITVAAAEVLQRLPYRHTDPFDRTIAATAIDGTFTVLTPDAAFDPYSADGLSREW